MPSRLERPKDDRVLAGVCSGLARQLDVDPTVVRVATVVLGFLWIGVVVYLALVLLAPESGEERPLAQRAMDGQDRGTALAVGLALIVGVTLVDEPLGWIPGPDWPFVLLAAGAAAIGIGLARRDRTAAEPGAVPDSAPDAGAGDVPTAGDEATTVVGGPPAPGSPTDPGPAVRGGANPRRTGALALGTALLGFGIAGAVLALADPGVGWDVVLAGATVAVGIVLLVAAPFGGARLLVPLGFALAGVSGVAAAADLELAGGVGERTYRPTTTSLLPPVYEMSVGALEVDLRDLDLPPGTVTRVRAQLGFGELLVRVPADVPVTATAHAAGGEVDVLGEHAEGLDVDQSAERPVSRPAGGPAAPPRLHVDADVGFGEVRVVDGDDFPMVP